MGIVEPAFHPALRDPVTHEKMGSLGFPHGANRSIIFSMQGKTGVTV
jgi:hypothetical protein